METINLAYGYVPSQGFLFFDEYGREDHVRSYDMALTWNRLVTHVPGAEGQGFARYYHAHNKHADGVIALCK